ncbi:hypothetical protein GYMLUDRAFT_240502 [Collybiopsis luxurians FD-317 M1]|nr:hypothetical protein GYMLUDRAFT_240502 [Collybiopsis luxurians FD-317 M1]
MAYKKEWRLFSLSPSLPLSGRYNDGHSQFYKSQSSMFAFSPACDLLASSLASTTKAFYQQPSAFIPSLSDLLYTTLTFLTPSSFRTSPRQQAFFKTPAQRRVAVTTEVFAQKAKLSTKGHHKRNTSLQPCPEALPRKGVTDELMLKDSLNLPSITEPEDEEEKEPCIFYSTPLPQYHTTTTSYCGSKTSQRSPTRPLHHRRLSDLKVIPEGLEE